MNAWQVIDDLRRKGVLLALNGQRVVYDGPVSVLTADRIEQLRAIKPALVEALRQSAPGIDWRALYEERLAAALTAGQSEATARLNAYEICLVRWLNENPIVSDGARCVECGLPDLHGEALTPFGVEAAGHAWLHSRCWPAWHAGRRAEATAALANAGVT